MLFQQTPAETFDFMLLGFGVILGSMALFLVSLAVRFRNLRRDLDLLQGMDAEESA